MTALNYDYDEHNDTMTIEDIRYSGEVFRQLGGMLPVGRLLKLVDRGNGTLTIQDMSIGAETIKPSSMGEDWQIKHEATPELRERALDMALRTDGQQSSANGIIWTAEKYIDYILRGEK